MAILKIIFTIQIIILLESSFAQINNIRAIQKENTIEITYDLYENISVLSVSISEDGGKTFDNTKVKSITGSTVNIQAGTDKVLTWNTLSDIDNLVCNNLIIKLTTPVVYGSMTDPRDSKAYKTVKIGTQLWMAENLAFRASSGCWAYNNDESKAAKYGRLYIWETAISVCPSGWHLPSKSEWSRLIAYLDDNGGKMKVKTDWDTPKDNTNESGFNAFPAGSSENGYKFNGLGYSTLFWSSTVIPAQGYVDRGAWMCGISDSGGVSVGTNNDFYGYSVRCLKN